MYARRDYSVFIMPPPPAAKSGGGAHAYRKIQSWWPGTALSLESSPRSLSVTHAPCPGRYDMHMHTAEHAAATFQPSTSNPAAQPTCQHAIMPTSCHHHRAVYPTTSRWQRATRAHKEGKQTVRRKPKRLAVRQGSLRRVAFQRRALAMRFDGGRAQGVWPFALGASPGGLALGM